MSAAAAAAGGTSSSSPVFEGRQDRFRGVTVYSNKEPCDAQTFTNKLNASLSSWQENNIRGVWFRVAVEQADWIPILAKNQFWFHHVRDGAVMMCRWLSSETCNIPQYCHTMLSVGGLVVDSKGRMLVIKERFFTLPHWKLPGGYMETKEDIGAAAVREVLEETGIRTRFVSLIGFMHSHTSQFGGSDIYLIARLEAEDEDQPINKCEREIADCCWMKIDDYIASKEVAPLSKRLIRAFLANGEKVSMPALQVQHPIFQDKTVTIYSVSPSSSL